MPSYTPCVPRFIPLPQSVWRAMQDGAVLSDLRVAVPYAYESDFDVISKKLKERALSICRVLREHHERTKDMKNKEFNDYLKSLPEKLDVVRQLLWQYRNTKGNMFQGKARVRLFDMIKPVGDPTNFYQPSDAMRSLLDKEMDVA